MQDRSAKRDYDFLENKYTYYIHFPYKCPNVRLMHLDTYQFRENLL